MGIQKAKQKLNITEKNEKKYEDKLNNEYSLAYKLIRREIMAFIANYGVDGKLTSAANQYNRFDNLAKAIAKNMANIKSNNPVEVNTYLKDQFMLNYYYTGFTLESEYQQKLGFRPLLRKNLDPISPMSKVSLQENKDVVRGNLNRALTQAIAQGEGVGNTSAKIKSVLEKNLNNSLRIARTETTTAMNQSSLEGMLKASEILPIRKEWVATLDNRTRDRHRRMDGEIRELDNKFSNGLMYPGDQSGKPEEVINCRCTMIEVLEGYKNPRDFRLERGLDGKNNVIPYKTYEEWEKERL